MTIMITIMIMIIWWSWSDHDHNNDDNHDHDNDDGYERWGWLKKCLDGDDDDDVCPNLVFQTLRERDFEPACWGLQEVFPLH